MVNVNFFTTKDGAILGFNIQGHAEFNLNGQDIVCASISSAAYMVANTITEISGIHADVRVDNDSGMILNICEKDFAYCRDILLGFKLHMLSLENMYPQNITVNYTEV